MYILPVELARGKLNDIRNQLSDWIQMGLRSTAELEQALAEAQRAFVRAVTSADRPEECARAAQTCLQSTSRAGDLLIHAYTSQILQSRLAATSKLSTHVACVMEGSPKKLPAAIDWPATFNTCHLCVPWNQIAPIGGPVPLGPARRPARVVPPARGPL